MAAIEFQTEVLDIIQRTHNVKSFRFKAQEGIRFKPGQFFFVTIKIAGTKRTKHFSFSNSPTEKGYVEFTKRITDSEFSKALDALKIKDSAGLKMPYGAFTFEGEYKKAVFLCAGIGITPARSILKFAADKKISSDIRLLYGNSTEADIIFRKDLDVIAATAGNIHIVYTLTNPDAGSGNWSGRRGRIDTDMIKEVIPDYSQRVFYVCGPPAMVTALVGVLKNDLGIVTDNIKTENFIGY